MTLEQRVDRMNAAIHEHAAAHAAEIADHFAVDGPLQRELLRRDVHSAGEVLPVPPALLPREAVERLRSCHEALRRALDFVFDGRLEGSWGRLADALRLEPPTRRYVEGARRPRWLTIARPDVVLAGDDFTIVEPNAGSSCGVLADADVQARAFLEAPVIGDFLRALDARPPDNVAVLAAHLRKRLSDAGLTADLVVVTEFADDLGDYGGTFEVLAAELRRHGLRATVAAVEDLEGGRDGVALAGERCGIVYRLAAEEPDPERNHPLLAPILEAGRAGTVVIADELEDAIAANKTILAVLSEELDAGRLPADLAGVLRGFLPWTRVLEDTRTTVDGGDVDLVQWVVADRERLVLKPGAGFCGRGVLIGCEVGDGEWAAAVDEALTSSEAWIVQRTAMSAPTTSSIVRDGVLRSERTFVDYGYFAIGDQVPTGVIRKNAPFGTPTRRVKLAGTGPVFVV
ncbi:hypothetical protein [Saccharothrix variisporea]|uniref:Circularly permuted ATP-grasp superfamily protein n=1 Tax=Saccharothrix variisporea TaxID=543527 RepID=A0A495X4I3_9PSEU|nr:hypothetical protein [Saccharothrix variisporea]RKT69191.1 hypothetical protein DFJ66_2387 [Saccharothrix variisporea]